MMNSPLPNLKIKDKEEKKKLRVKMMNSPTTNLKIKNKEDRSSQDKNKEMNKEKKELKNHKIQKNLNLMRLF